MRKVGAVMGKALFAGTALAGVALGATILKTAQLGDEAAKTSRRMGITAESLQELRFAADRQGVSSGVLASSFTALQKRVGELKSGTGSLFGFLKKTGDKAFIRQISLAKNTEEAFELITKKAETIEDPLKKAAFAAAAFSRTGTAMVSFMEAGTEGIQKLREEAQKYGAVISDKAAGQSEIFVDSLTNLKSSLTGIGKTFAIKLIPGLSTAMQKFADFWALNKKIINQGMDKFLNFVGDIFIAIKPGVVSLFNALKKLFSAFWDAVKSLLPQFKTESDDLSSGINSLTGALQFVAEIGAKAFDFIREISPFLKPLITLFLVYQGLIIAIAILTKGWAIAQGILNMSLAVNPITLIILGIAALITGIILLIQNWDAVVAAFSTGARAIWDFLSGLLDNPFLAAAGVLFAPFITIPALIVKHWEPISDFFVGIWEKITGAFGKGIDFVMGLIEPFKQTISGIGGLFKKFGFDFGGSEQETEEEKETAPGANPASGPQVVTQSEQLRRTIEETRETAAAEVLIRDETGRAQMTRRGSAPGIKIAMVSSGDR